MLEKIKFLWKKILRIILEVPECVEWFIEYQAFSSSYDLAPHLSCHPLLPSASCLSLPVFLCVADLAYWQERGGGGVKLSDDEKAWSSSNHSILSGGYTIHAAHCKNNSYRGTLPRCAAGVAWPVLHFPACGRDEKSCSSTNHSILSGRYTLRLQAYYSITTYYNTMIHWVYSIDCTYEVC